MAHQTMVGGTKYAISGGSTLVGGTAYSLACGKTLVDGTACDIAFGPGTITVKITGTGNKSACCVTIAGTKYYSAKTLEIEAGTKITAYVSTAPYNKITFNGTTVFYGGGGSGSSGSNNYAFVPDCAVVNIKLTSGEFNWTINITTS